MMTGFDCPRIRLPNTMIVRSPFPDVTIPEVPLTQFVLQLAQELGDKPALIEGPTGRVITYAQLNDAVRHVAASLDRRGFKKGEVFGILSPNIRSEERRVGKECRSRWSPYH